MYWFQGVQSHRTKSHIIIFSVFSKKQFRQFSRLPSDQVYHMFIASQNIKNASEIPNTAFCLWTESVSALTAEVFQFNGHV